jgi:hypothetical protein
MSLMVMVSVKDIITSNPPSVRDERVSVLMLPVVGWVLRRTVLQSRETRRVFMMIERMAYAAASGFIWWGAFQMRRFRNYRLSVFAARLALVPWVFSGFPFGLVFGFRALRRLRLPEVKARFDVDRRITN